MKWLNDPKAKYFLGLLALALVVTGIFVFSGHVGEWNAWRTVTYGSSVSSTVKLANVYSVVRVDLPVSDSTGETKEMPMYFVAADYFDELACCSPYSSYVSGLVMYKYDMSSLGRSDDYYPVGAYWQDGTLHLLLAKQESSDVMGLYDAAISDIDAFRSDPRLAIAQSNPVRIIGLHRKTLASVVRDKGVSNFRDAVNYGVTTCQQAKDFGADISGGISLVGDYKGFAVVVLNDTMNQGHKHSFQSGWPEVVIDTGCKFVGVASKDYGVLTDMYVYRVGDDYVYLGWNEYAALDLGFINEGGDMLYYFDWQPMVVGTAPAVYIRDGYAAVSFIDATTNSVHTVVYDSASNSVIMGAYTSFEGYVDGQILAAAPYRIELGESPVVDLVLFVKQPSNELTVAIGSVSGSGSIVSGNVFSIEPSQAYTPTGYVKVYGVSVNPETGTVAFLYKTKDATSTEAPTEPFLGYEVYLVRFLDGGAVYTANAGSTAYPGAYVFGIQSAVAPLNDGHLPISFVDNYVATEMFGDPSHPQRLAVTSYAVDYPGVILDVNSFEITAWNENEFHGTLRVCGQSAGLPGDTVHYFGVSLWDNDYSTSWRAIVPVTFHDDWSCQDVDVVMYADKPVVGSATAFDPSQTYKLYVYSYQEPTPIYWNLQPEDATTYLKFSDLNMSSYPSEITPPSGGTGGGEELPPELNEVGPHFRLSDYQVTIATGGAAGGPLSAVGGVPVAALGLLVVLGIAAYLVFFAR